MTKKNDEFLKNSNTLYSCIMASIMTAVLICIVFAFGAVGAMIRYSNENKEGEYFAGYFLTELEDKNRIDESGIVSLSAEAVVDMMKSGESGLVFVRPSDCPECELFSERVRNVINEETDNFYQYTQSSKDSERAAHYMKALFPNDREPSLVYIKNGSVYDRIDDFRSESNIHVFIEKYL